MLKKVFLPWVSFYGKDNTAFLF